MIQKPISREEGESSRLKGALAITASALGFAGMAACVRLADDFGGEISSFQKSFFRNIVALVVALVVFLRSSFASRISAGVELGRLFSSPASTLILLLRSVLGTCGIFANFYALSKVSIADCQTLNKTAPFFTVLFAWFFLGEKASRRGMCALAVAFSGVLFVAKPAFAGVYSFPLLIALSGGAFAGGAYAAVRALKYRNINSSLIVLFFRAFSSLASIPFIAFDFAPMTLMQVLILVAAGSFAALGQFGITMAYGYSAPRDIAVYDYSNILFTAAFGLMLFGQVPDIFSIVGFALILTAVLILNSKGGKKSVA